MALYNNIIKMLAMLALVVTISYGSDKLSSYIKELDKMSETQASYLVASYYAGDKIGMGLSLAGIVWKESNFGKYIVNSKDGKYGSFGLAQILLTTAMKRNNVKGKQAREELKLRLMTDHAFNLKQAVNELRYWKEYYTGKTKYVTLRTVASYNAGWKGYSGKGKEYSNDVKIRRLAILKWLSVKSNITKFKSLTKYLKEIRSNLVREGLLK